MKSTIRKIGLLMLFLVMSVSVVYAAGSGTLSKINFRENEESVVIDFKSTDRLRYRVKEYDAPSHLLVQFYGTVSGLPFSEVEVGKGNVSDLSVREIEVNGQTATFISIHLNKKSGYDFDLSPDGSTFSLTVDKKAVQSSRMPASGTLPPEINIPGSVGGTSQIPYSNISGQFDEFEVPNRIKEMDTSPYIVGPVILQDADVSQTVRLLSEAAGGANIVVESGLVQEQATAGAGGITVTLSHITLEDALDIITSSNNWSWRKFGDYYAIMKKETASLGVNKTNSSVIYDDTATRTKVVMIQPQHTYACVVIGKLSSVIADIKCDPATNMIMMRGMDRDLQRAKQMLVEIDRPQEVLTKQTDQIIKTIQLKYISLSEEFETELKAMIANPYFADLRVGVDADYNTPNTVTFDYHSNSIVFIGDNKIYERFYDLLKAIDVTERATVLKTIPLKYITIRDLLGEENKDYIEPLEKIIDSNAEKLIYSEPTNTFTFIGSESKYEDILSLIKTYDVEDREYVTRIVPLKYVHVGELAGSGFLEKLALLPGFGSGKETDNMNLITNFDYNTQTNSVIVSTQKQYVDKVCELIASLDKNIFENYQLEYIKLKYTHTFRVTGIISMMLMTDDVSGMELPDGGFFSGAIGSFTVGEMYEYESQGDEGTKKVYPQSYKWVIAPDASQNAIMVLARPQEMELIKKAIEKLDKPYPQIKLDVQIVELVNSDSEQYKLAYVTTDGSIIQGANLDGSYGDFNLTHSSVGTFAGSGDSDFLNNIGPDLSAQSGVFLIYNTLNDFVASFGTSISTTVEKANGRVVASPTLVAPENKMVQFDFTDKVPYVELIESGIFTEMKTSFAREGFAIEVIPHFNEDYIVLDIKIEVLEIKGYTSDNIPVEGTREISSEIKCKNNVPIILGGMTKSTETLTKVSLPLVSKLPLIGSLFRKKLKDLDESEVVVVITPTILPVD